MHSKLTIASLFAALAAFVVHASPVVPSTSVRHIPGLPFTKIVVFGDSFSDNGNDQQSSWALSNHEYPGDPAYYNHNRNRRWSNDHVWVERLASGLGVTLEDNAVGGATTSNTLIPGEIQTYTPAFYPPGVIQQVQTWVGSHRPPRSDIAKTLFIIIAGANDGFNFAGVNSNSTVQVVDVKLFASRASNMLAEAAQTLGAMGAKHFLFATYPDLSRCPIHVIYSLAFRSMFKTFLTTFNGLVPTMAHQLEATNPSWKITVADFHELYQGIFSNPKLFGFSKGMNACVVGAYGLPGYSLCSTIKSEQNKYVFWDGVHPTGLGHEYVSAWGAVALAETYF